MALLLGTDVVHIPRVSKALERFGDRFLQRLYTPQEQADCWRDRPPSSAPPPEVIKRLAGRWAAKEAIVKALGTGWTGMGYTDIEIRRSPHGAPTVHLHRAAHRRWSALCGDRPAPWQLSISHDGDYAFAVAIALATVAPREPLLPVEPSPIE
ncbi:MAG: holo-ACP synthase [Cyanobacteria bacterium]|nr:holo-ACP synthase [Cyanobacteriota bacterium]